MLKVLFINQYKKKQLITHFLLLSLCSRSLRQYSQALSFSSCSPVFVPCRLEGNILEKLNDDILLWCFPRCVFGFPWALTPVSSGSSGKLKGVWGLESLPLDRSSNDRSSGDLPRMGDWDRDWFSDSCGEERDKGMIKPVEDWEPMDILSILDWLWLRTFWDGDPYGWVGRLRFSTEPGFEAVENVTGEWLSLGETEVEVVVVNVRCWSQDRNIEKLWMFKTWSGKQYWAVNQKTQYTD